MKKVKYQVRDWADNICLHGEQFDSFDEADEALGNFIENVLGAKSEQAYNEERGEYWIVETNN